MSRSQDNWENLDITPEEAANLTKALKNEEFRKLFVEYCKEMDDPENKKLYETEIIQLEKERGVDVTFINPSPGYVIKTIVNGNQKAFINVCTNENVGKPSAQPSSKDGVTGASLSLPHTLAQPKDDLDKKRVRCKVYDVVFHPDTLKIAEKNLSFRDTINKIACDAVESNFAVELDKINLKFPQIKYKGRSQPTVIRKPSKEGPTLKPEDRTQFDDYYDKHVENMKNIHVKANENKAKHKIPTTNDSKYTVPNFVIKHRNGIDLQDFTNDRNAKINATVPKELVVEIDLPLLKTSSDIDLDVTEKSIALVSEKPSKYKLDLTLPYKVYEENGKAKFDTDLKKLIITLPVKRCEKIKLTDTGREDSGVESDHSSPQATPLISEVQCSNTTEPVQKALSNKGDKQKLFLDTDVLYTLPEHTCNYFNNTLVFTLHVKNAVADSIEKCFYDSTTAVHLKFTSLSPSFVPIPFAFYVKLPAHFIDTEAIAVEVWDNNVIVQVPFLPLDKKLDRYLVGLSEDSASEEFVREPSMFDMKLNRESSNSDDDSDEEHPRIEEHACEVKVVPKEKRDRKKTTAAASDNQETHAPLEPKQTKARSVSESSCDEFSESQGSYKSKGILKRYTRSFSESSMDELVSTSLPADCYFGSATVSDSYIPEESEGSCSLKKTVRFNEVVHKQVFRVNSSILGQRKKNQRKSKNKKKAQERRLSESETSETEDKRNMFLKNECKKKNRKRKNKKSQSLEEIPAEVEKSTSANEKSENLIFDLDI